MALINDVQQIFDRLANAGWRELMLKHGIDIRQSNAEQLAEALGREVEVDKSIPGFSDFAEDRARGIEPGNPAASLLYHAFASPGVQRVPGEDTPFGPLAQPITDFPTMADLDTVENYIFAQANRSLADVRDYAADLLGRSASGIELAVAVFSAEYRPAPETPHQRYADLCLSRTGVARVGTAGAIYDGKLRGYVPFREGDSLNTIRVLPCRYVTWLAARSRAEENRFGPARVQPSDSSRDFWVPVHKLFDGDECLTGETLTITLASRHQNKKIERLHSHLENVGVPSGYSAAERQQSPFIKEHGLADWVGIYSGGAGLLSPQAQPFVERASFNNEHLTFAAPAMGNQNFGSAFAPTLSLNSPPPPVRPWPEYAHVRFDVQNGNAVYFGEDADAIARTAAGGYRALNISDSTGDGWVRASVSGPNERLSQLESIPAYSLIAAPDFFPGVDQREIFEWWEASQSPAVKPTLPQWFQNIIDDGEWDFWRARPIPLSDERHGPNIQLTDSGFSAEDETVTAIVTPLQRIDLRRNKPMAPTTARHAVLPDAAAGIFAPGWDTSADRIPESATKTHLSAYGLGSPFPEDAKLCAALSTFWPAVAPDTARTFYQVPFAAGTVCPLTDEENGAADSSVSWDGLRGPRVLREDGFGTQVRFPDYEHADYTLNAFEGQFSIAQTRKIDFQEYTGRILATLRMYRALKNIGDKDSLHILSFRRVAQTDALVRQAQAETMTPLAGTIYRFDVFDSDYATELPAERVTEENYSVDVMFTLLVGRGEQLLAIARRGDGSQARSPWQVIDA
ncbi:MAG: hypothetical protein AAFP03_12405 [Cyanobacteria bacterium J06598_3]